MEKVVDNFAATAINAPEPAQSAVSGSAAPQLAQGRAGRNLPSAGSDCYNRTETGTKRRFRQHPAGIRRIRGSWSRLRCIARARLL